MEEEEIKIKEGERELRICELSGCGNILGPHQKTYCCMKHFRLGMGCKNIGKLKKKEEKFSDFPYYICPHCGERVKLDFDPHYGDKLRRFIQFKKDFICPKCGLKSEE